MRGALFSIPVAKRKYVLEQARVIRVGRRESCARLERWMTEKPGCLVAFRAWLQLGAAAPRRSELRRGPHSRRRPRRIGSLGPRLLGAVGCLGGLVALRLGCVAVRMLVAGHVP